MDFWFKKFDGCQFPSARWGCEGVEEAKGESWRLDGAFGLEQVAFEIDVRCPNGDAKYVVE